MSVRAAVGIWTLALLAAGAGIVHLVTVDNPDYFTVRGALGVGTALLFVAAGLVTWLGRPGNRTGAIMVLVGFAWFLPVLPASDNSVVYAIGALTQDIPWALFGLLVLSYPSGRLEDWQSRLAVGCAASIAFLLRPAWVLTSDLQEYHESGPANGLLVWDSPGAEIAFRTAIQLAALVVIAMALTVLSRRWRAASPALRRTLTPVYASFGASALLLAAAVALQALSLETASQTVYWAALGSLALVPLAFAVGLLRTRLARAGVGQLLLDLGDTGEEDDVRDALARTLGDPSIELAYWLPDQSAFVDQEGNPLTEPLVGDGPRHATLVERRGERVGAIIHDVSLLEDRGLLEAVGAAAGLSLQNERRLAELKRSQARLRALVDALPDLMFRLRRDGTYLAVQAHDEELLAVPADQLIGRNIADVLPADAAQGILAAMARLGPETHLETVEYELVLDGKTRHFEARLALIAEDEAVLVVRDISERRERELQVRRLQVQLEVRLDELNHERQLVRAVVQSSPSFFCIVEDDGRIVRFNRALEQATGVKDGDETRGQAFWDIFVVPEEIDEVRTAITDAVQRFEPLPERENRWTSADGTALDVAWALTPLPHDGEEQPFLVTGIDVTERARHEAELRGSRARIVEAASTERRRLERNLHDGAQQRLVSLSLFLRLALTKVRSDPDGAEELLTNASDELARALEELRELARGIHPAVLTDRGLEPALQSLVTRTPVPVTVAEAPRERLPEPVEAAAYYVVAEALTNVAKYAKAQAATVRVSRANGRAVVEVADDGVGGADATRGSGLRGLADRVEALDGTLVVTSPPGGGTTIRAEIPV